VNQGVERRLLTLAGGDTCSSCSEAHSDLTIVNGSPRNDLGSLEVKIVCLLSVLTALHVFVFTAAFPFFNSVDEQFHFDLWLANSHADIPRGLERVSPEALEYIVLFSSRAYLAIRRRCRTESFPRRPGRNRRKRPGSGWPLLRRVGGRSSHGKHHAAAVLHPRSRLVEAGQSDRVSHAAPSVIGCVS